jgi:16S rRNA (adenine(1408)-N(1))-methyltransferase
LIDLVRGKRLEPSAAPAVDDARRRADRVLVDVGTGDGREAYRTARAEPGWLVVGFDPEWRRMVETATRSQRRPEKGGAPNLVLVRAAVEQAPAELHGIADEVRVRMPWGRLLRGVALGEPEILRALRVLARPGAPMRVTVGTSIWAEPVPLEIRDLPELTPDRVRDELAAAYADAGWRVEDARYLSPGEVTDAHSSWSRRISRNRPGDFLLLSATAT